MSVKMISNAISAVLAMGIAGISSSPTLAASPEAQPMTETMGNIAGMEKCYGIAKAGQNDCGTGSHACAGEAKLEKEAGAWILVPNGTCNKIAGASLKTPEKA